MIERVDRTLWTEPDRSAAGHLLPASSAYYGDGILPSLLDAAAVEDSVAARERLYNPRDDDFLRRGGSQRTSKYRARMEKARKEFIQGTGASAPVAPEPSSLQHSAGEASV